MVATVVVINIQTTPCGPPTPFYALWDGIAYELIPGQSPVVGLTLVALDIASVTTGGTAVTALNAGHCTAGGFIQNPIGATTALGINQIGAASGTTSAGNTTFIQPGQVYNLVPSGNAVSVISSDSSHAFSGMGLT